MTRLADTGPAARPAAPARAAGRRAAVFVLGTWALLLLAALAYVASYGRNVPFWDDYSVVPVLAGEAPAPAAWLWQQHSEHRVPLQKLVILLLLRATGADFRSGMVFSVLLLGAAALALSWTARQLRGRWSPADAFFPLLLLFGAHCFNVLNCWQVTLTLPTALACALLAVIVLRGARLAPGAALLVGCCLALLFLCGALGLPFVLPFGLWLGYAGTRRWRAAEPHAHRDATLFLALAAGALLLVPLYFAGYRQPTYNPASPGLRESLRTSLQFLSVSLGSGARKGWEVAGPAPGLAVLGLIVPSVVCLAVAWWGRPDERLRAAGLLAFLGAMALLALGVGHGRAGSGPEAGLVIRYVTLAVPALLCLYYVWQLYGPPAVRPRVQAALCAFAGLLFLLNVPVAFKYGGSQYRIKAGFERDLRDGVPVYLLVKRHTPAIHPNQDVLAESLRLLRRAGVGPFARLQDDPPFREVPLPVAPARVHEMTWDQGAGRATGVDPYLVFRLPAPRPVAGIRLTYTHTNRDGTSPRFRVDWKAHDRDEFTTERGYEDPYAVTGPAEVTRTVWVADVVGEFRIHPDDQPCSFALTALVLLVPTDARPGREEVHGD
jgi:hypothetical protein